MTTPLKIPFHLETWLKGGHDVVTRDGRPVIDLQRNNKYGSDMGIWVLASDQLESTWTFAGKNSIWVDSSLDLFLIPKPIPDEVCQKCGKKRSEHHENVGGFEPYCPNNNWSQFNRFTPPQPEKGGDEPCAPANTAGQTGLIAQSAESTVQSNPALTFDPKAREPFPSPGEQVTVIEDEMHSLRSENEGLRRERDEANKWRKVLTESRDKAEANENNLRSALLAEQSAHRETLAQRDVAVQHGLDFASKVESLTTQLSQLQTESKADKERLDWLESFGSWESVKIQMMKSPTPEMDNLRSAIDAARANQPT